jgi:hypothetical protein
MVSSSLTMTASKLSSPVRSRELRRRVVLPARLRTGVQWSDTCILNISSRGLLIHSARIAPPGSQVELRRGEHVIVARVMWRDGGRVGLQSEERLPVEEIMALNHAKALQLVASEGVLIERRKLPRSSAEAARLRGRAMEFFGVAAIAAVLAAGTWATVEATLARPLVLVESALDGQSCGTCSR